MVSGTNGKEIAMAKTSTTSRTGAPTEAPPEVDLRSEEAAKGAVGTTEPEPLTGAQLAEATGPPSVAEAAPRLRPPGNGHGAVAAEAITGVTATWRTGVTVTALWSINEIRNAWAYLSGIGWRKIYNGRDGAFMSLVALASQARQTGRPITAREEADGMLYEIYLW
jgi:hypothetical protein